MTEKGREQKIKTRPFIKNKMIILIYILYCAVIGYALNNINKKK